MKIILSIFLVVFSFGTAFSQIRDTLYANPQQFTSSTIIHFDLENSSVVSLMVFNRWGEVIKSFYQSDSLSSGSYDNIFLGDSLANNAYYVCLEIDQKPRLLMSVLKNSSLGLDEKSILTTNFSLSPNPVLNLVNIPFEGSKTIQITDLNGKLIQSITTDETSISLTQLEKGEYLISIYNKENQLITKQKIIKID